ncbi:MAG: CoA transferase [Acetobacteraceae bacterium]
MTPSDVAALPLRGVRVLDLSRIYSGPYCTFLLAMAGAEVIKVETPDGEHLRKRNANTGAALPFPMLNANKRFMTLDIKTPRGRDIVRALVPRMDVLVENFRPDVMDQFGLGRKTLTEINPRLIYASINGFGREGPYRNDAAMDLTIQARSGIMDSTGFQDNPPVKAGPAICDFYAGVHLYGAIVSALLHRERTGEALAPEVAMLDAIYPSLCSNLAMAMADDNYVRRTGNRHGGLSQCPYNVYPAADGYFAIICINDRHWRGLLRALGREDLDQPRFATISDRVRHMDYIDAELAKATASKTRGDLAVALNAAGVPCGPVHSLTEVIHDPHLHANGMLCEIDHPEFGPLTLSHSPLRFLDHPRTPYQPSQVLGAETASVLAEIGIGAADLAALRNDRVI